MDDDRKKFPRKTGPKPSGPRKRDDGPHKPGFAAKPRFEGGKPFEKRGERDGAKKPFAKRGDAAAASGASERPKRDFKRDDRPRDVGEARPERGAAPFRKGPRPEGKPYQKRDDAGGAPKPYAKRRDEGQASERPKRDFNRDDRPREGGEARPERSGVPFRKGPRPEGKPYQKRDDAGGAPKPYAKRRDEGQAPIGDRPRGGGEKPFRPRPEGKPFVRRPDRDGEAGGERPARRFDRPQGAREGGPERRPRADGFKPAGDRKPFVARPREAEEASGERIAKRLARVGIASRRDAEELIAAGRVRVNNKVLASPAFNVMPDDIIHVDGLEIPPVERTRLFLFHKPAGVVTTNRDPEGRKTVFDILPAELPRLMTIGRLDINTEGLLLLTNDGGLSRVLELPATGWLRRYRVRVHGKVDEKQLAGLKDGMAVDGVFYGSIEASLDREQGSNAWLTIGLREGKNREVKNILGALGLDVTRLIRISYGPFQLGELAEGHVQEMNGRMLRDQLGERLIEESGANFDADIVKPFSNKPVRRDFVKVLETAPDRAAPRAQRPERIGEGGLVKNRKRDQERHREDMLGRLQTKPDRGGRPDRGAKPGFGDKPRGKKPEREQRPIEPPGARKANVWMAPGARPIGTGRAASEKAEHEARKASKSSFGKPRFDKPGGEKPGMRKSRGEDAKSGDRPSGPRKGKSDADRRR
ncbi:MAG: pseudouridine synthase [Pseudaminobacter sp.]|nr:pseudouridine synthase [Pseudaminobacter sp.]